jgi:fatty acid desaturase
MIILGKEPVSWSQIGAAYVNWNILVILSEIMFGLVFFNRGHHGNGLIHQNDEIKSFDFGEYQLSTTADRVEANRNVFMSMAFYGEQVLHHLFPALDLSILPQLKETLRETCKEFDVDLQPETTMLKATVGQMKQLFRSEILKCS